jgi:hypothetical protein
MEKLLLKQGKPFNRSIKKMEPIQGNPCSLNRSGFICKGFFLSDSNIKSTDRKYLLN